MTERGSLVAGGAEGVPASGRPGPEALLALRFGVANLVMIAAIVALLVGGWTLTWVILAAMLLGGPIDETVGDDRRPNGARWHLFHRINLYLAAPLTALLFLASLLAARDADPLWLGGAAFGLGYLYSLVGVTVAHELTHWTHDGYAQFSARFLLAFTCDTHFTIFHLYGHHRFVGTDKDPATAKRGETFVTYFVRASRGQFLEAWSHERERLRRRGRAVFSTANRVLTGQALSLLLLAIAAIVAGLEGAILFIGAAIIGRVLHEMINYVQHYGLVRVEGTAIAPRHSWDCYRAVSSALFYNLPRHAEHHMFASKPYWELGAPGDAPMLPFGYQTMGAIALVPPLWRRIMAPRLADWDARLASDAERRLLAGATI